MPVLLLVPLGHPARLVDALLDVAHVALGGALALVLASWFEGVTGSRAAGGFVGVVLASGLLLLLELLQPFVGRGFGWDDAVAGACGAVGAVLLLRGPRGAAALATAPLALAALALGAREGALGVYDAWRQRESFPLLASFEDDLELRRVTTEDAVASRVEDFATEGRSSLRVELAPGPQAAVALVGVPRDWRTYGSFSFDVEVDGGGSLPLILEIVDAEAGRHLDERYRETYVLHAGENHVDVPLGRVASSPEARRLDLGAVREVRWSVEGLSAPRTIHLDGIRLLRAPE